MMETRKLTSKIIVTGNLIVITGLHIGAPSASLSIGGNDNPIIRDPLTNEPYIPGSSLKGKLRALHELSHEHYSGAGKPSDNPEHLESRFYGMAKKGNIIPARLIVRDLRLSQDKDLRERLREHSDLMYAELKWENNINRITSEADPRPLERVPAGAKFDFEFVVNLFEGDDMDVYMPFLIEGLKLLSDDYLGGSGSRGSGKVAFDVKVIEERPMSYYSKGTDSIGLLSKYIKEVEMLRSYIENSWINQVT